MKSIQRLLADAYMPNLDNSPMVYFIDGNAFNLSLDNMKWGTKSDIGKLSAKNNTKPPLRTKGNSKITEADAVDIRRMKRGGVSQKIIGSTYGLCKSTISYIVNNKTWAHI